MSVFHKLKELIGKTLKRKCELFSLNSATSDLITKLVAINDNLDVLVQHKTNELEELNRKLQEKEEELSLKNSLIISKEELLTLQNQKLQSNEEELKEYINKLFEQQERERIVKWIVTSIRESLELDNVLSTLVEEVGKLLKVDRCLIALYDPKTFTFNLKNEYRISEDVQSVFYDQSIIEIPEKWYKTLINDNMPIVVNNSDNLSVNYLQKLSSQFIDVKSFAIAPVIHKSEMLGVIIVHQTQFQRDWGETHVEILKDIGSQIAIAISQAFLYTKVQESTRLKSQFLASMSHEFRTPLNAIIGFSEMIMTGNYGNLSDKQEEYLSHIANSGKHLLRLVNDILDLSKVESGNMELQYEKFDSQLVISETIGIVNSMAMKKNIKISLNLADAILSADNRRFKQIMYNLVSNAIKFTEENGEIVINTSIAGKSLRIEVQDTGIGISQQDREKIFTQFSQIDSSYARKQEGTGLGLTLTKKLIELHNGVIDFESHEGQGTKFWFEIPGIVKSVEVNN